MWEKVKGFLWFGAYFTAWTGIFAVTALGAYTMAGSAWVKGLFGKK